MDYLQVSIDLVTNNNEFIVIVQAIIVPQLVQGMLLRPNLEIPVGALHGPTTDLGTGFILLADLAH